MTPRSAESLEAAVVATGLLDLGAPGPSGNAGDAGTPPGSFGHSSDVGSQAGSVVAAPGPSGNSGDAGAPLGSFGHSGDVGSRWSGPLLVLCSAGRDSACLLDLAVRRRGADGVRVLHVDHALRAASRLEADLVREAGRARGVEVIVRVAGPATAGPPAPVGDAPGNVHAWARAERARIAADVAREVGAVAIATAHTRTDLVETALFRLATQPGRRALLAMRAFEPGSFGNAGDAGAPGGSFGNARDAGTLGGSFGHAGDAGVPGGSLGHAGDAGSEGVPVVRPLLGVGRDETLAYCIERGLRWVDDPSNADRRYARARLRHSVTPVLRGLNPRFEEAAVQTLRELEEERDALRAVVDASLPPTASDIPIAALDALPRPIARLVLRELCERAAGRPCARAGSRLDEILARAAADPAPFAIDVGEGVRVSVRRGLLHCVPSAGPAAPATAPAGA